MKSCWGILYIPILYDAFTRDRRPQVKYSYLYLSHMPIKYET